MLEAIAKSSRKAAHQILANLLITSDSESLATEGGDSSIFKFNYTKVKYQQLN
jgi:hypothetical protein